jgi:hypothetical protein
MFASLGTLGTSAQANGAAETEMVAIIREADAIRRFQLVRGAGPFRAMPDERLSARRESLQTCLERVKSTLQPQEMNHSILFGKLSVLDRDGECWVVEVDQGQGLLGSQVAYLDAEGRLLFAWRVPEG